MAAFYLCLSAFIGGPTALAQVRTAPQGNEHPQADPPAAVAMEHFQSPASRLTPQQHAGFAAAVDVTPLRTLAVFDGGRIKILDTLARETLTTLYGKSAWKDRSDPQHETAYDPLFTLLDLRFNKPYYFDKPIIYVEVLPLRRELLAPLPPADQEHWLKLARLTPSMLAQPHVRPILAGADADLRLHKGRNALLTAAAAFDQAGENLLLVPSSPSWVTLEAHGDPALLEAWEDLELAWRRGDASAVNAAMVALASAVPTAHASGYPPAWKLRAERLYNQTNRLTTGYVAYLVALVILATTTRRGWTVAGVALLTLGLLSQSAAIAVRWLLAERNWIPLHNQYESFVAIGWFGVMVGMVLMAARRQKLFGVAAAALGAATQLLAGSAAIPSSDIEHVAGILNTSNILKVHVTLALSSYGLIALAFVVSLTYLLRHYFATDKSSLGQLDRAQLVVMQLSFWVLGISVLLGAYWADHAWGRWWAWDPKETWALITWIIYLIVIHVRFTVQRRGLVTAWLGVLGFVVMLWTYWGVNLLLSGLHSYA